MRKVQKTKKNYKKKLRLTHFASFAPMVRVTAHHVRLFGGLTRRRVFELFERPEVGPPPQPAAHDRRVGEQERPDGHALGRVRAAGVHGPEQRLQLPVVEPFEQGVAELPFVRFGRRRRVHRRRRRRLLGRRRRRARRLRRTDGRSFRAPGIVVPTHPRLPQAFS